MISLQADRGWLCWQFRYRIGDRIRVIRVFPKLRDTRDNRRELKPRLDELKFQFAASKFDLAREFPEKAVQLGLAPAVKPTLLKYARARVAELKISRETRYDYESLITHFLAPADFAARPIDQITRTDLRPFVGSLGDGRRARMVRAKLRAWFDEAVQDELIAVNPMPRLKRARTAQAVIEPFNAAERAAIMSVATDSNRALIGVLLECGTRPSEMLAAEWKDIDWKARTPLGRGVLRIERTLTRFRDIAAPKTPGSVRDVHLTAVALRLFREQRARSGLRRKLIFPNESGKPLNLGNFERRQWKRILEAAKVEYRPVKMTRHSYAVAMIEAGHELRYVAGQMGHTGIAMLERHYARWLTTRREARKSQGTK